MFMQAVRYFILLVAVHTLLLLAGCDRAYREATTKLTPGQSTGYDVRDVYGPPAMEYKEADGSLVWEFPKGPAGLETYMIKIGPDNKMVSRDQVLSEPFFTKIQKGQSRAEVRRVLGKPASNVTFDLKKEEVWMWRYQESGATMNFHVHFDLNGSVLYSSKLMEQTGR
jgi:hypothetical protein